MNEETKDGNNADVELDKFSEIDNLLRARIARIEEHRSRLANQFFQGKLTVADWKKFNSAAKRLSSALNAFREETETPKKLKQPITEFQRIHVKLNTIGLKGELEIDTVEFTEVDQIRMLQMADDGLTVEEIARSLGGAEFDRLPLHFQVEIIRELYKAMR